MACLFAPLPTSGISSAAKCEHIHESVTRQLLTSGPWSCGHKPNRLFRGKQRSHSQETSSRFSPDRMATVMMVVGATESKLLIGSVCQPDPPEHNLGQKQVTRDQHPWPFVYISMINKKYSHSRKSNFYVIASSGSTRRESDPGQIFKRFSRCDKALRRPTGGRYHMRWQNEWQEAHTAPGKHPCVTSPVHWELCWHHRDSVSSTHSAAPIICRRCSTRV